MSPSPSRFWRPAFVALALGLATLAPVGAGDLKVEVDGIRGELATNVFSLLSIHEAAEEEEAFSEARIERLHAEAPGEIRRALEPFGYYRPTIDGQLTAVDDVWTAVYDIDAGDPVLVGSLDLRISGEGRDLEPFQAAVDDFPLAVGEALSHAGYEAGKKAFAAPAAELGFFAADFTAHEARVDLESYSASVTLHYDTGPRYLFGAVRFQQDVLDPGLLAQYVDFERGAPFDMTALRALQAKLADSAYFRRVEVVSRPGEGDGTEVPVDVRLTPNRPLKYTLGAGYGTDTGARGSVNVDLRRVNRQGHRGKALLRGSELEKSLRLTYLVPVVRDPGALLGFSTSYQDKDTDTSESEKALIGASYSRPRRLWRETFSLFFQREDYVVGVDSGISELLVPSVGWTRVTADDRIFPSRGHRLRLELRGAAADAGSDASFLQASAEGKYVLGFGKEADFGRRHRWITRGEVGYLFTDDFRRLPPSFRFFAGGDQSVRGFDFEAIGRLDEAGNVIGGESLAVASVAYERWFTRALGAAVFVDAGNASESFDGDLKYGAGVGFRWRSPVGPVRVDVAWPLSEDEKSVRFHLSIGPEL